MFPLVSLLKGIIGLSQGSKDINDVVVDELFSTVLDVENQCSESALI